MDQQEEKKSINTKFVGHHISAGGYIFFKNKIENQLFVILLKNKKGEWWIPKGHIESWESDLQACYREINEEVGIKKDDIVYVGPLENYKFSFLDENNKENTKEIYIHIFKAHEMLELNVENGGSDVVEANWFSENEALAKIMPYSKKQLENAIVFFNHNQGK